MWNSELPFGQAQNQAYGYLFPHGAFFLAGHLLGLPGWVTQRLWWALLLTVGFWGLLAGRRGVGHRQPDVARHRRGRVRAVAAGADHARVDLVGDAADDAGAVGAAARDPGAAGRRSRRTGDIGGPIGAGLAAQAGVAMALMGAVNADRDPDRLPGRRDLVGLSPAEPAVVALHRVVAARRWCSRCSWWVVALVLLGRISPPFLDFIESSGVTTQWIVADRGAARHRRWTPFVAPTATAGASLVTGSVAILATTLVAAAGMAGLAMRSMPAARGGWSTILLVGVVLLAAGYWVGWDHRSLIRCRLFSTRAARRCATCTSWSR